MENVSTKELSVEKTMTVKEVADVLGVTDEAIKKHIRTMFPDLLQNGKTTFLNEEQVTAIKAKMIPTTKVVGATTDLEMEQMTLKVLQYHMTKETEYKQRAERAESMLEAEQSNIEFAHAITDSKSALDMGTVAKVLDKDIGRNNLFAVLRENKILQGDNQPYQEYIDRGWFRVVISSYHLPNGDVRATTKTLVLPKGIKFINQLINKVA